MRSLQIRQQADKLGEYYKLFPIHSARVYICKSCLGLREIHDNILHDIYIMSQKAYTLLGLF